MSTNKLCTTTTMPGDLCENFNNFENRDIHSMYCTHHVFVGKCVAAIIGTVLKHIAFTIASYGHRLSFIDSLLCFDLMLLN